jgi:hypothetical protein
MPLAVQGVTAPRYRSTRCSKSPLESRSSTISGIRPAACVEHDRHGSKQRTAASTRFNMPSCKDREETKRRAVCSTARFMARLFYEVAISRFTFSISSLSST